MDERTLQIVKDLIILLYYSLQLAAGPWTEMYFMSGGFNCHLQCAPTAPSNKFVFHDQTPSNVSTGEGEGTDDVALKSLPTPSFQSLGGFWTKVWATSLRA